jgi:hypothetical protein
VLHYSINPTASGSSLTGQQIVGAINAAAQAWMAADPAVQLVYDGTTTNQPALNDVVGFGPEPSSAQLSKPDQNNHYTGFSITISVGNWDWRPCDPVNGRPCSTYSGADDLQNVVSHEWGHVLGLGHPANANNADTELTMYGGFPQACNGGSSWQGCRAFDTLGLGDVRGERALYPTSAPIPTLYSP